MFAIDSGHSRCNVGKGIDDARKINVDYLVFWMEVLGEMA